jgi:beta-hydroxylase
MPAMSATNRVLLDAELDGRLRRDGFVTLPAFDPGRVAHLRDRFGELSGWNGSGFQSDLVSTDLTYRQDAAEAIGAELDRDVSAMFDGYVPFLHSFLCKFPGEDSSLYLHRDWMYVDEREGHRTFAAWVALEDIDGHNGQLRVLRGSHLLDPSLRGTDLIAPWIRHQSLIDERLLAIPVKAGDVIIFDNALIHSSFPNYTTRPRVAAAVGLRPKDARLVHFRRVDERSAQRFDVDEKFFLTSTPQDLMGRAPDLPVAEDIELDETDFTELELTKRLDADPRAKLERARRRAVDVRDRCSSAVDRSVASVRRARARMDVRSLVARGDGPELGDRVSAFWDEATTRAAVATLGVNEATINRFGPAHAAIWDPAEFAWSAEVERKWPEIRAEVQALLDSDREIPHIEDVTGGIPQGNVGPWRTFILMHQGRWIDWNCARCPETTAVVRKIPGLTVAGFSVLEPGTHITTHRGPNKGALRYQLGVIVPGEEGDCRIRVGDEMIHWRDGEGVMFDFTYEHEAWNDTEEIRVLLMLELITPLPWYLDKPNRLAQHAMSWFPTTRDMAARLRRLEPTLVKTGAGAG